MKVSFPHWHTTPSHSLLHTSRSSTTFSCSIKPKTPTQIPARDRVIDFGRHKGKMIGTLPSTYLKWVSNNLRARDFEHWARLADQVLTDPVYKDRIEWEFAERVLNGDVSSSRSDGGAVSELLEISQRFGWDNEDRVGWGKVDFGLLGTSKGGRIPRVSRSEEGGLRVRREKEANVFDGDKRRERRERLRLKRGEKNGNGAGVEDDVDDQVVMTARNHDRTLENRSPFPGRESLLKKVLSNRKRF